MAVSSKFTQKSLFGGGSTKSNTPKIDTSYGANLGGGQQNNIVNLPTLSGGGNSGGLTAANENVLKKTLGNTPTVTIPQNLTYQNNLKNMTGIIGQGGASGGVTNEGVIVGNPNVEKMPTINRTTASGSKPQTSPMTYGQQLAAAAQQQTPTESTPVTSGGTGATGSTGSTGGSTAGSGEVDTYEEFLNKQEGLYKQQYEDLLAQIEAERQRGVIDARSSYEQNKATYGANAEQLAAMGLSGSGYSDYLNQQAYATQRAETQGANAQAESNRLQAELSYTENMMNLEQDKMEYNEQKQAEKEAMFDTLYDAAISGAYSSEQLKIIGEGKGFTEEEIKTLTDAANKYRATYLNEFYRTESNNILSQGSDYNTTYLENALSNGDIDQETYDKLMKDYTDIVAEESDSETLENLHEAGKIDDITYKAKIDEWNKNIDTSTTFFNGADYTAGKQAYEEVINNPWATEETKAKLKASYIRTYAENIARQYLGNNVSGNIVDVNSDNYNPKQWGDYTDINKANSGQGKLITRLIEDANAGKIKEGQVVTVNYGQAFSEYGAYIYVGDGVFVKCKESRFGNAVKTNKDRLYIPEGYEYSGNSGLKTK